MWNLRWTKDKALARLFTKFPLLLKLWAGRANTLHFSDTPWTPLIKELSSFRLALITTGGVHQKTQQPFGMLDPSGDPTFREIPGDADPSKLVITHNYYDHAPADRDINIILPLERAADLEGEGSIGGTNHRHFSFMGHILDEHIGRLSGESAPAVAAALKEDRVDIAILTPG